AMPYPDNPEHTMPAWALGHRRTVIVRGVITPAGRVDTATAQVDDPSDERYAEAAMTAVAQMRFVPAEYDGAKVPAPIEIVVPFGAPESADSASRP
ncbi:MAG TPA: TonB family protein, partial [Gemmatimonadaceae bacterium]|nr:TonB family protein [Gemmatimonadaceae bacterium]